jgi:outer membrane protein assembly factor BamB
MAFCFRGLRSRDAGLQRGFLPVIALACAAFAAVLPRAAGQPMPGSWSMFGANAQHTGSAPPAGAAAEGAASYNFTTGEGFQASAGVAVDADGRAYVGSGGTVHAVNANGSTRWSYTTGDWVNAGPALSATGELYIGSADTRFYALNATSGDVLWFAQLSGAVNAPPTIGPDGTVYVGCSDGQLFAFAGAAGAQLWSYQAGGAVVSAAALSPDGDVVYVPAAGQLHAVSTATGAKVWNLTMSITTDAAAAVAADGTIFVTDLYYLYAVSASGAQLWRVWSGNETPAIGPDGTVYVGGQDGLLYAMNPTDGSTKWTYNAGAWVNCAPALSNDGAVYITAGGSLIGVNAADGTLRWAFSDAAGSSCTSPSIGRDGRIFAGMGVTVRAFTPPPAPSPSASATPSPTASVAASASASPSANGGASASPSANGGASASPSANGGSPAFKGMGAAEYAVLAAAAVAAVMTATVPHGPAA